MKYYVHIFLKHVDNKNAFISKVFDTEMEADVCFKSINSKRAEGDAVITIHTTKEEGMEATHALSSEVVYYVRLVGVEPKPEAPVDTTVV